MTDTDPIAERACKDRIEHLRAEAQRILRNPRALPEETRWARFYVPMLPKENS
jgi:hypothetical protein